MQPSERYVHTELGRVMRRSIDRDPVENALYAFFALTNDQRAEMAAQFNAIQSKRAHPQILTLRCGNASTS